MLAGDTRHTAGYNINSRTERKVYRLGEDNNLILATVGFGADSKDVAETMTRAVNVCIPRSVAEGGWLTAVPRLLSTGL